MSDLAQVARDFARGFEEMRLPYALMGGLAVRAYGIPRATYDIDFTISILRQHLPTLYGNLKLLGYTVPEAYESGWVDEIAGLALIKFEFYLQGRFIGVDVFLAESPFQRELMARRRQEIVDGLTMWLVSAEDLILLKLIAGRPRDFSDIADVLLVQGQFDEGYMRIWARQLGVLEELNRVLTELP